MKAVAWAKRAAALGLAFLLGFAVAGYAVRDVRPRSFLALDRCDHCWSSNQIMGLLGSMAMQHTPGMIPVTVLETDRSIAMRMPDLSRRRLHFVIVPKRDILDAADLGPGDEPYLVDAFAVIGRLVREHGLTDYQVLTKGPGDQSVRYLHFHLISKNPGRR